MNKHKPEWYARLRKGPFSETIFGSEMLQKVEARASTGRAQSPKRRLNPWATAVVTGICLFIAYILIPAQSQPVSPSCVAGGSVDEPAMSIRFVVDQLQVGMSKEEVKRAFGEDFVNHSIFRDFSQEHKEDPNDMSTWSAVEMWRYDFGVHGLYQVAQGSGITDQEGGFDLPGIINGKIDSQLIIYWKGEKVNRAIYKSINIEGGIDTTQIGPAVEEAPPTNPPATDDSEFSPDMPPPNEGVRAVGETSFGLFELRPIKGGDEKIQTLGAPSCLGQETDIQYAGDYELYFINTSGKETLVQEFKHLEMIHRENEIIKFMKLDFSKIELYLFIPRHKDCHGLEFYAYGIDKKSGEVSNFTFLDGDVSFPEWATSPVSLPQTVEGKLVVEGGYAAGQDGATRYVFVPDLAKHQLVLKSKQQIP